MPHRENSNSHLEALTKQKNQIKKPNIKKEA
jgi:hypothetical protein